MALIVDPDNLNQDTEVVIDTDALTIQLLVAGNLSADGVTLKALYSFLKEEWKTDPDLPKFLFPMLALTNPFYEMQNGWTFADSTTEQLIRRSGWLVRNTSGNLTEHWAGFAILSAEADDQIYYDIGAGATDFNYVGNTSEAVQVISDPNGDGSYVDGFNRSANITVYNRQQGQLFSLASTSANGEASLLEPQLFSLSVPTGDDLNVTESDGNIASEAPYTGMSITYYDEAQSRAIGASSYNFGVVIDANEGTAEEVYEFVQYQLRQNADIDDGAGTLLGQLAEQLLQFIGGAGDGSGTLRTLQVTNPAGGGGGVFIDNFQAADTNRIEFTDNTGALRTFPFVAVLTLNFNTNLVNDAAAEFWVYFTDANGNEFGTADAILVDDNSDADMVGDVSGSPSVQLDFDYDNNVQGGRTAGTDADVTVVAIGLNTGQYVVATGTITRSVTNAISLVAPIERNYENAA